MRCDCCDKNLSDYECSLKNKRSEEYLNTCLKCLQGLEIDYIGNQSLKRKFEEDSEYDFDQEDYKTDLSEYTDWITKSPHSDEDL